MSRRPTRLYPVHLEYACVRCGVLVQCDAINATEFSRFSNRKGFCSRFCANGRGNNRGGYVQVQRVNINSRDGDAITASPPRDFGVYVDQRIVALTRDIGCVLSETPTWGVRSFEPGVRLWRNACVFNEGGGFNQSLHGAHR